MIAITFVVTAGLLYTSLTYEQDLEAFHLGELKALLGKPRPLIPVEPSIEGQRQRLHPRLCNMLNQKITALKPPALS